MTFDDGQQIRQTLTFNRTIKRMENSKFTVSIMAQHEVQTAINWASHEGRNSGINDASAFYAADVTGFWVGKYEDTPIATISAVKYGKSFGFMGLYIVHEAFRGKGFGMKMWETAISSLRGRNIGLDGVLAQQENYKKSGFKLAHRNIRFAGKSTTTQMPASSFVEAKNIHFQDLENYDKTFFPAERSAFLKAWVSPQNTHTLAIVENSKIVGYGSIRTCERGFKIGPLNAENGDLACDLFLALTARIPEASDIFLDVPEPNKNAILLAQKFGMTPVFETARMYTNEFPPMPLEKIYGITTFELG
ncbi:MAG: GNAT family N-acetyltransferase [Gallionella sp.]|nr:GNAT family N-acetyltransferase [Gallionella sp.]